MDCCFQPVAKCLKFYWVFDFHSSLYPLQKGNSLHLRIVIKLLMYIMRFFCRSIKLQFGFLRLTTVDNRRSLLMKTVVVGGVVLAWLLGGRIPLLACQ